MLQVQVVRCPSVGNGSIRLSVAHPLTPGDK